MAQHESSNTPGDSTSPSDSLPDAPQKSSEAEDLIHDLGTPLTIISGYVQLLRRRNRGKSEGDAAAMERSLEAIEGAVERMKKIVSEHRRQQSEEDGDSDNDRP